MAEYQITEENFGKQVARAAKAMRALPEFDQKLHAFLAEDDNVELTKAQKKSLTGAVDDIDDIINACLNLRDQYKQIVKGAPLSTTNKPKQ